MTERWWPTLLINNEWFAERHTEWNKEHEAALVKARGFPLIPRDLNDTLSCGFGYFDAKNRWVLPLPNIYGRIHMAKCWRPYYGDQKQYRWMTAGGDHAKDVAKRGEPIGRVWDLPWLLADRKWRSEWLFFMAGEWDCITARLATLPATCLTIGESASAHTVNSASLLVEFGGKDICRSLLSKFKGIAVVYDTDEAGDKGAVLLAGALADLVDDVDIIDIRPDWLGVRAINLRESPWYDGTEGWDFSDLAIASKKGTGGGVNWLIAQATKSPVGKQAIADSLHVDLESTVTSGQIFAVRVDPWIHIEDLIDGAIQYAKALNSRAQGVYHMGIRAEDGGWVYDEIREKNVHVTYINRVNAEMPKEHPFTEAEFYSQLKAAMQGTRRPEYLDNEHANMIRLRQYYNFLRFHPIKGWKYWNGVYWESGRVKIFDQVDRLWDKIDEEAAVYFANGDAETAKRLKKWANVCRKNAARANQLVDMASKRSLFRPREEIGQGWDIHTNLLGTVAGPLDLMTGEYLEGAEARDAYCSLSTRGRLVGRHDLDVDVQKCWRYWESLLEEWQPRSEQRAMLQEIAGTALNGVLDEHLWLLKSSGRSGKSTFLDALAFALGDYAYEINGRVLGSASGDNPRSSAIAGLDGKRLTVVSEIGGQKLDIETIKSLTGERTMMGRAMRIDWEVIKNCSTFIAMANLELNLGHEQSEALRGRLVIIDWPMSYVDQSRIASEDNAVGVREGWVRTRQDRVKNVVTGADPEFTRMADVVLTWMFEGWGRVRDRGYVEISAHSLDVTNLVWTASDPLAAYFGDPGLWVRGGETIVATKGLWNNMRDWATRNGDTELGEAIGDKPQALAELLKQRAARGFESKGRLGKAKVLWPGEDVQCQSWKVPWTYVGPR